MLLDGVFAWPTGVETIDDAVLAQLRSVPLFNGLSMQDLTELLASATVERFEANRVLFRPGEVPGRLFVVLDGHVEVVAPTNDDQQPRIVEIVGPGTVLGDADVLGGSPTRFGAMVLGQAVLVSMPAEPFVARLHDRFDLVLRMMGSLSFRLRTLVRQVAELKLKSTAQRLGGFLLSLTQGREGEVTVRFPYDKRLVAEALGMKPESLSRALARLRAAGVTSHADNTVTIAEVAVLRDFCMEDEDEGGMS